MKAKALSLKGREPEFFLHPPAFSEKCPVSVWGPAMLCRGQAFLLRPSWKLGKQQVIDCQKKEREQMASKAPLAIRLQ